MGGIRETGGSLKIKNPDPQSSRIGQISLSESSLRIKTNKLMYMYHWFLSYLSVVCEIIFNI